MTTQFLVRIDSSLKNDFSRLARTEGKNASQKIRELIEGYVKDRDVSAYVDDLWGRMGRKMRTKGVTPRDIDRAVRDVRRRRHE